MAKKFKTNFAREEQIHRSIDALAEYEAFCAEVMPALRADLASNMDAESLYKKYESMAAARGITIALTDPDSGKALQAIKDIRDRSSGKAKESKEVVHRLEKMSDEELDAVLLSEEDDLDELTSKH